MRRKLDLGASLVGEPRLLLLDEPTTGLDPRSRIELWDAIRSLVERDTDVLLTTQYLDEADNLASRIVIIDRGRNVVAGTPQELKQRAGRSVIEVHVRDQKDMPTVAAALANLDHGEPQVEGAIRRVSIAVEAGTDRLRDALNSLEATGATVEDVSLRPPKLDEVFLALTGQALEQATDRTAEDSAA
jgi:ABC-2 type transport system ATP-binding protein